MSKLPSITQSIDRATPTLFQLVFPILPIEKNSEKIRNFSLNLHTTSIPGINIGAQEFRWQGGQTKIHDSVVSYDDWSVDFIVDENYTNWLTIYDWIMFINNNKDQYVRDHREHSVNASLLIKNNWKKNIFTVNFIDVWPTALSEVSLSSRSGTELAECNVTFAYDRYEIIKEKL